MLGLLGRPGPALAQRAAARSWAREAPSGRADAYTPRAAADDGSVTPRRRRSTPAAWRRPARRGARAPALVELGRGAATSSRTGRRRPRAERRAVRVGGQRGDLLIEHRAAPRGTSPAPAGAGARRRCLADELLEEERVAADRAQIASRTESGTSPTSRASASARVSAAERQFDQAVARGGGQRPPRPRRPARGAGRARAARRAAAGGAADGRSAPATPRRPSARRRAR